MSNKFDGIKLDENGRLIPTAYDKIKTFENGKTPVNYIYVGLDGNDLNPGTYDKPFATFDKALSVITPGTSLLVKPGVYAGAIRAANLYATEENPIWIGGIPNEERPVLDGDKAGLSVIKGAYIIIHDLEISNIMASPTATGMQIHDAGDIADWPRTVHHFVFRNLYVHHINYQQFKFSCLNHYWLFDCEISHDGNGQSAGIDTVGGVGGGVIAYNYFHDFVGVAIQHKGNSFDTDIFGNLFVNIKAQAINAGQCTGTPYFRPMLVQDGTVYEGSDLRIYSNIFIETMGPVAFWSSTDCYFVNNTVINPTNYLLRILPSDITTLANHGFPYNNTVANNIFYYDNPREAFNVSLNNAGIQTCVIKNNLFHSTTNPGKFPDKTEIFPLFIDNITADPLFSDENYALKPNSPAASGGVKFDFVKEDYYGRPVSDNPSLGAVQLN